MCAANLGSHLIERTNCEKKFEWWKNKSKKEEQNSPLLLSVGELQVGMVAGALLLELTEEGWLLWLTEPSIEWEMML
jgi:hypothetical protein